LSVRKNCVKFGLIIFNHTKIYWSSRNTQHNTV